MIVRHLCALVTGLVLGWLASPASASKAAEPIARLRLENYRKGVEARVDVGGRQRLFQLDTAGGLTVISPALAKELNCGPWGSVTGFHMTGTKISAPRCDALHLRWGDLSLTSPVVAVMEVGSPDTPIDGLLALDAFAGRTITIDFARREVVVESPASLRERIVGTTEVPAHLAHEIGGIALSVFVEAPTAKGPIRLELDSGNGGTILVSRSLLKLLGLPDHGTAPQQGRFSVAPGIEAAGLIFSPQIVIDGNLGMPLLKDWVVTMDLAAGRVWFKRSAVQAPAEMGTPPFVDRSTLCRLNVVLPAAA